MNNRQVTVKIRGEFREVDKFDDLQSCCNDDDDDDDYDDVDEFIDDTWVKANTTLELSRGCK